MCCTGTWVAVSTRDSDWVCIPSLLTARYLPSGLSAAPNGFSPSGDCLPAG
jgi:hypothetical protein